ncbi:MAG TPA: LL-diaminopimelate aminotransferase [Hyphomonadaceae bacterium]|nr:LL-diaminopimelate aminotransferase [Hyphomonadaceae bacterium]
MRFDFHKIRRLPPYVFEQVNVTKAGLRAKGADVIDLGMGNPDLPTPPHIVEKLCETARKPDVHGYSASRGIPGLRRALAAYYDRRFGVKLDPMKEVVVTLGSKEGFANLAQAITSPGDTILVPNPSYPLHSFGFIMAGATIRSVEAHSPEQYLSNLSRAVKHSVPPPTAMVVCYPANPTAQVVELDFYKDVIAFAKKHEIIVLSDLAYTEIYFDKPPPSILQVEGAKDIAVEVTSMSKTYAMAGWRVGFAAGNEQLIAALARVKSYLDYGAFTPVQVAAAAALNGPQNCVDEFREIYRTRRDAMIESFARAGWDIPKPTASMFAWAPIPEPFREMGSLEFSLRLIKEAHVAVAPGAGFGEHGDNYVRLALVENEQRIRQAARNVRKFLEANGVKVKPDKEPKAKADVTPLRKKAAG